MCIAHIISLRLEGRVCVCLFPISDDFFSATDSIVCVSVHVSCFERVFLGNLWANCLKTIFANIFTWPLHKRALPYSELLSWVLHSII